MVAGAARAGFLDPKQLRGVAAQDRRLLSARQGRGGGTVSTGCSSQGIGRSVPSMIWLAPTCATGSRRPSAVNTMASK